MRGGVELLALAALALGCCLLSPRVQLVSDAPLRACHTNPRTDGSQPSTGARRPATGGRLGGSEADPMSVSEEKGRPMLNSVDKSYLRKRKLMMDLALQEEFLDA